MPVSDSIKRVPYSRKPQEMSVDEWQAELRKQFATDQKFKIQNIGDHPLYSDFEVYNPETGKTYKVSIRDNVSSYNYCSCPDFKVNTLGTCKHIEYVLFKLLRYKKYQMLDEYGKLIGYKNLRAINETLEDIMIRL